MSLKPLLLLTTLSVSFVAAAVMAEEPGKAEPASTSPTQYIGETEKNLSTTEARTGDVIDHSPFEVLLKRYVDERGQVAYATWAASKEDQEALRRYVDAIGRARVEGKSEASRLAFYINAYNALVLQALLKDWPVESVMELDGFFTAEKHRVANASMTLDDLEHNRIIRVQFAEPRIHFVLVCAARSCPPLLRSAMTETTLEAQLEAAAREFIPAATRRRGDRVLTSQLFNWFKQDFEKDAGSVAAYLARYVDAETARALRNGEVKIEFSEYDWSINAR